MYNYLHIRLKQTHIKGIELCPNLDCLFLDVRHLIPVVVRIIFLMMSAIFTGQRHCSEFFKRSRFYEAVFHCLPHGLCFLQAVQVGVGTQYSCSVNSPS